MDCSQIEREETAEAYLGGRLSAADQADFERHVFECPCCLEKLRMLQAVQAELWEQGSPAVAHAPERRLFGVRHWALAPAAALILVLAGATLWWQLGEPGRRAATAQSPYAALASFDPPPFIPLSLRRGEDEAAAHFRMGMDQYVAGRFEAAIPDLRAAESIDPRACNVLFFLGISYLLEGQTDKGISRLEKVISLGDAAYAVEARFYLAKAYLEKGDASRARAEFEVVMDSASRLSSEAARLLAILNR